MCDIVGCTKKLLNTDEALDEAIPLEPAIVVSESLDESISESISCMCSVNYWILQIPIYKKELNHKKIDM